MRNLKRSTHALLAIIGLGASVLPMLDGLLPDKTLKWAAFAVGIIALFRANWGKIWGYTPS